MIPSREHASHASEQPRERKAVSPSCMANARQGASEQLRVMATRGVAPQEYNED